MTTRDEVNHVEQLWLAARTTSALSLETWALFEKSHEAFVHSFKQHGYAPLEAHQAFLAAYEAHRTACETAWQHLMRVGREYKQVLDKFRAEQGKA